MTDQLIERYRAEIESTVKAQAGFRGALLLMDPVSAQVISITLWDETEMIVDSVAFRQQLAGFADVVVGECAVRHFAVCIKVNGMTERNLEGAVATGGDLDRGIEGIERSRS